MTGTVDLPDDLIIRTPPGSPSGKLVGMMSPASVSSDTEPAISVSNNGVPDVFAADSSTYNIQMSDALRGTDQVTASRFRRLRKDLPFNRFMPELLNICEHCLTQWRISAYIGSDQCHHTASSDPLLIEIPFEWTWTPGPQLFGGNPSLEILARLAFHLSNSLQIDWTSEDNGWFLNWLGVSADFTVLRAFFSIKSPTVCAVYERLCRMARYLKKPAFARVLFEIRDTIRNNNAMFNAEATFLHIAVEIGSKADGMLAVAESVLKCISLPLGRESVRRPKYVQYLCLVAAARRDTAMLRLLVGTVSLSARKTEYIANGRASLLALVMLQLYAWDPEQLEDDVTMADYVGLLVQGGILSTGLPDRCCCDDRPQIPIRRPGSLTVDELIMVCPPIKRKHLYDVVLQWSNEHRISISRAGIFTAALEGEHSLLAYHQSRTHNNAFDLRALMQECLFFAASLNDTETASALLELGTDPEVGLLSENEEEYHKGFLSWNPMIVAAAAGNVDTLNVFKNRVDLAAFVKMAPVFEVVQVEDGHDKYGISEGRELHRLENLQRHYLYSQSQFSDADIANISAYVEEYRYDDELLPSEFFPIGPRRIDTLAWIRNIAMSLGVGQRLDKEIIQAALFNNRKARAVQSRHTAYHPCDVLLLEGLVDANLEYHEGDMDLLHACIRTQCSLKVVVFLLGKGFHVHSRPLPKSGNTMLHDALLSQSPDRSDIVNLLLREGADYKHCGEGLTVLEASLQGKEFVPIQAPFPAYLDIFTDLFKAGAPVRHRPRPQLKEWQPLICRLVAAEAEDDLILRVLDAGADLNERGRSKDPYERQLPLEAVIRKKRENLAQELIRRGADVHAPAGDGFTFTALQAACVANCSFDFIEYLINVEGAKVNEPTSQNGGYTALQGAACNGSLSVAELLLAHGSDVNALSGEMNMFIQESGPFPRFRALDKAAEFGRLDMVEFLLKAGGRSGAAGLGGAIALAKMFGRFAILSVLLDWEKEHGSRIVEEVSEWQQQNPDRALVLLDSLSDDDSSEYSTSDSEGSDGDFDE